MLRRCLHPQAAVDPTSPPGSVALLERERCSTGGEVASKSRGRGGDRRRGPASPSRTGWLSGARFSFVNIWIPRPPEREFRGRGGNFAEPRGAALTLRRRSAGRSAPFLGT